MKITVFPTEKSQVTASVDDDLFLMIPPYNSETAIYLRKNDNPEMPDVFEFSSWEKTSKFLHYQAAQRAAISVYPVITRSVTDTSSYKTQEKAKKLLLKNVLSALNNDDLNPRTPIEVSILRLVFGEEKVSRSSLMDRYSWMENSTHPIIHQILIEAGHEPFDYKSWSEIIFHEVALSWRKNQQFSDIVHWCMFAMLYYDFGFSDDINEELRNLYNISFKEQQKMEFINAGGLKREPWQKKIKTRR